MYAFKVNKIKYYLIYIIYRFGGLLLGKLLEINTSKRYTADKVLKHPWLTRNPNDEIPKTYLETMKIRTLKNKMIEVMNKLMKKIYKIK
jgi:hypothetical protein